MKKSHQKFSVLISVYSKESPIILYESLYSIWHKQTVKPSEIILVKDGPLTKELDEIICEFKCEAPLKIISLPINMGLGFALNMGLKVCSNELVARMDSDDISISNRFEKQINFFRINPETDILGGQIIEFIGSPVNITGSRKVPLSNGNIKYFSKTRCPFNHPTVMFKKSSIEKIGSYVDFKYFEDYHLWIRAIKNNLNCANLKDDLLYFRTSIDTIGRRQGLFYFTQEIHFAIFQYKAELITFQKLCYNIATRGVIRLLPKYVLKIVYGIIRSCNGLKILDRN